MSCTIGETCICCHVCADECHAEAISEDEENDKYVIDPEKCDCCKDKADEPMCAACCPLDDAITCNCT